MRHTLVDIFPKTKALRLSVADLDNRISTKEQIQGLYYVFGGQLYIKCLCVLVTGEAVRDGERR